MVKAKWLSLLNHVANIHEGHSDLFPVCLHGDLDDEEGRPRKWMEDGIWKLLTEIEVHIWWFYIYKILQNLNKKDGLTPNKCVLSK